MKKLIIFICILFSLTACCESSGESYKQATVTFMDGTTKVYNIRWCLEGEYKQFNLVTTDGEDIYLTDVKEIYIKRIVKNKTRY